MTRAFVNCFCHCRRCGEKLVNGICEMCGKDRIGSPIAGIIFAVLFGLAVWWLMYGHA